MKDSRCLVGIIGFGPVSAARTFHAPLIGVEPRLHLKSVSTMMPREVRPLLPDAVTVTEEPGDILGDDDIGLVVVATPNTWHYQYAKQALDAGKHVVVEKPLALTVQEADELLALAQKHGLLLTQFHNRRWDGGFLTAQKILHDGLCGDITFYEANYDRWVPKVPDNWREKKTPGGGTFVDLGVHLIDQALALFGRPQAVTAVIRSQRDPEKADDYFSLQLDYGRLQAVLRATMLAADPGPRYKLGGTKGTYTKFGADPQAHMLNAGRLPGQPGWGEDKPEDYGYFSDGQDRTTIPTIPGAYQEFYAGLAAAVIDGAPQPVPAADARDIIAIIEAAFRSEAEGRQISADEIGFIG